MQFPPPCCHLMIPPPSPPCQRGEGEMGTPPPKIWGPPAPPVPNISAHPPSGGRSRAVGAPTPPGPPPMGAVWGGSSLLNAKKNPIMKCLFFLFLFFLPSPFSFFFLFFKQLGVGGGVAPSSPPRGTHFHSPLPPPSCTDKLYKRALIREVLWPWGQRSGVRGRRGGHRARAGPGAGRIALPSFTHFRCGFNLPPHFHLAALTSAPRPTFFRFPQTPLPLFALPTSAHGSPPFRCRAPPIRDFLRHNSPAPPLAHARRPSPPRYRPPCARTPPCVITSVRTLRSCVRARAGADRHGGLGGRRGGAALVFQPRAVRPQHLAASRSGSRQGALVPHAGRQPAAGHGAAPQRVSGRGRPRGLSSSWGLGRRRGGSADRRWGGGGRSGPRGGGRDAGRCGEGWRTGRGSEASRVSLTPPSAPSSPSTPPSCTCTASTWCSPSLSSTAM